MTLDQAQNLQREMLPPIVKRALVYTVTDIGQLTTQERRELNRAAKAGMLAKGNGGPFPILKTVWAHPGFDFAADRAEGIAEIRRAHMIDLARGVAHHFPLPKFQ